MSGFKLPYTVAQVSEMFDLSREVIYAEIKSGRLPARHKRGQSTRWYITDEDLRKWIEEGFVHAETKLPKA